MNPAHCATAARERGDPMVGTAAPARRWLLIEYPAPWATHALQSRLIPPPLGARLEGLARSRGARVLLVRRHGRRRLEGPKAWAVVDHDAGQQWGIWETGDDLAPAADVFAGDVVATGPQEPVLLVCAHGLHDTCCAVRGRPVAAALADRWPEATWECSHIGGDRFAANLVVLPDGACYGNLTAASAVPVVEAHLSGTVIAGHLRGLSTEPPVVQAAIVAAHAELGPGAARDLVGDTVTAIGPDAWRVRLAGHGSLPAVVEATVTRHRRPPAKLTCRAAGEAAAYTYEVSDLRVPGDG
ncbi:sucrase ferredoxin [Knoellia sp. p5-6-4]|uniref:sucrase ferredoxin n=1 Tax=unclassified Knoellia TaxID=2618719 RepID=UPI0023DBC296|nr:sucrase ferredoxin [Knoellia sp. p5-6-4]MDF2145213.1 sucrase ferredoxin [Knoellia sp. p5-6-4]